MQKLRGEPSDSTNRENALKGAGTVLHQRKTSLCTGIRAQGKGLKSDGTSRFSYKRERISHYMGSSTYEAARRL